MSTQLPSVHGKGPLQQLGSPVVLYNEAVLAGIIKAEGRQTIGFAIGQNDLFLVYFMQLVRLWISSKEDDNEGAILAGAIGQGKGNTCARRGRYGIFGNQLA